MNILLSNDDGIDAPGLRALEEALAPLGTLYTVAPQTEQSAQSHALTLHKPLRVRPAGERRWAVSGTPADCVYIGLHHLLPTAPAIVVSGINRGANLGNDVFYSGTVAAAMEGALQGFPSVAVSLVRRGDLPPHFGTAGRVAAEVVRGALANGLPAGVVLNVNVPDIPPDDLKGLRVTRLGRHEYEAVVTLREDPRGGAYYWIGGLAENFAPTPGTDAPAVLEGYAAITPLHPELTRESLLDAARTWFEG